MTIRSISSLILVVLLGTIGCQHVSHTPSQDHQSLEASEFVHYLAQQPMATYDEVGRAVLLMITGEEGPGTFEQRVSDLEARGIIRPEWNYDAGHVVNRGTLAYMVYGACQMSGGLNIRLANWTGVGCERYAIKEVVRRRVMAYGLPYQIPTGGEVMRVLAKADEFRASRGIYVDTVPEISSPRDIQ